jgi:hypothetical protein
VNNTNIANTIYLTPLVERHVVDPNSPSSINPGQPHHGIRFNNKVFAKYRLADVIDRHSQLKNHAAQLGMPFQHYMANIHQLHAAGINHFGPGVHLPGWGAGQLGLTQAYRLDRLIMAMYWEKAWRVGWLDGNTIPTDAMISTNNNQRNNAMG